MKHLFSLFLTLLSLSAAAQSGIFPVDARVSYIRPSVYPEDLSQPGAATVTLRLADDRENYDAYLILELRDAAGNVYTTPNDRSTPPILFDPARRVVVLTGQQLQPWVERLSEQAVQTGGNGLLTEGPITLRAWTVDGLFPDEQSSNFAQNTNFAELHEPPTPTAPTGEQTANQISLLNFRWLANHVGAAPVGYTLRVYELPDIWANNPDVVLNTFPTIAPPVDVPGANRTSYAWLNAVTLLEPGKTYIYTVQARDLSGRLRFRNNGVSPPETFTYAAPTAVLDELCYVPDNLSILKGERLRWVGQDFVDVQYTVTVRELPEERFVSLSELAPTPTFPDRRPYNGGPQVQYGYDLPVPLDTTGGRAFRVKLCAVCPQTGEENCGEVIFGTPREVVPTETIPGDDIAADTDLDDELTTGCVFLTEPTVTVSDIDITAATVSWDFSDLPDEELVLKWGSDSLLVGKTGVRTIENLSGGTEYTFEVCADCGDDLVCRRQTVTTPGYDCPTADDILAGVTIEPRPRDAVAVFWSGVEGTNPLAWWAYVNDGSGGDEQKAGADAPSTAPPPNPAPASAPDTTITGLQNDTLYTITVCYRCPEKTVVCADFETEITGCDGFELAPETTAVGFDTARIEWVATAAETYTISYARAGTDSPPIVLSSDGNAKTLSDLRPTTTYDVVVCSPCGDAEICDSLSVTTTTVSCAQAGEFVYEYECGTDGEIDSLDMGTRITDLAPGDSIWAGDFLVEVGEADPFGGSFGGHGFAQVPYLGGAKLRLEFYDVEVNENCRMVAGEMVVTSPVRSILEAVDDAVAGFIDLVNDIDQFLGQMQQALALFGDIVDQLAADIDQWDELNEVIDAATGAVTQIPFIPQDLLDELEDAADCMRQAAANPDAPGAEQQMAECNELFQEVLADIQQYVDDLFDAPFIVDFEPAAGQPVAYGYDYFRYEAITEDYVVHQIAGEEYPVPWVSTSTAAGREGNAFTAARRDGGGLDSVTFIGSDRQVIPGWEITGNQARHVGLDGGGDQRVRHVFASVPGDTTGGKPPVRLAGQLSIVTYDPVPVTVHIVPVNDAAMPYTSAQTNALQQDLNALFHPAVVDVTVVIEAPLQAPAFSDTLHDIDNHPLSNYTPEMLDLRGLVKDMPYHNRDEYYLMVVGAMEPSSREGFMPRKRRFGFLNAAAGTAQSQAGFARLAAHELAHGAFHLQHTFDRFEQALPETTDNLMDYVREGALYRYQWGNVHDPEANFTLFDEEGEGESVGNEEIFLVRAELVSDGDPGSECTKIPYLIATSTSTTPYNGIFLAPSGVPIYLEAGTRIRFGRKGESLNGVSVKGAVVEFVRPDETAERKYVSLKYSETVGSDTLRGKFAGYAVRKEDGRYTKDDLYNFPGIDVFGNAPLVNIGYVTGCEEDDDKYGRGAIITQNAAKSLNTDILEPNGTRLGSPLVYHGVNSHTETTEFFPSYDALHDQVASENVDIAANIQKFLCSREYEVSIGRLRSFLEYSNMLPVNEQGQENSGAAIFPPSPNQEGGGAFQGMLSAYVFSDNSIALLGYMKLNGKWEQVAIYDPYNNNRLSLVVYDRFCGWVDGNVAPGSSLMTALQASFEEIVNNPGDFLRDIGSELANTLLTKETLLIVVAVGAGIAISVWAAPALAAMVGIAGEVGGVLVAEVALNVMAAAVEGMIVGVVYNDQDAAFTVAIISAGAGVLAPVLGKFISRGNYLLKGAMGALSPVERAERALVEKLYVVSRQSVNNFRASPIAIARQARATLATESRMLRFIDDIAENGDEFALYFAKSPSQDLAGRIRIYKFLDDELPVALRNWRVDINHLKLFRNGDVKNSLSWIKSNRPELFDDYSQLSPGQVTSLVYYTTDNGYQINFWLRSRPVDEGAEWSESHALTYLRMLDESFGALPTHTSNAPFLRYEWRPPNDVESISVGANLDYANYISTAKNNRSVFIKGQKNSLDPDVENFIIEVNNPNGVKVIDLQPFSQLPEEFEALVIRGRSLRVTGVEYKDFPVPSITDMVLHNGLDPADAQLIRMEEFSDWATSMANPRRISNPQGVVPGSPDYERAIKIRTFTAVIE